MSTLCAQADVHGWECSVRFQRGRGALAEQGVVFENTKTLVRKFVSKSVRNSVVKWRPTADTDQHSQMSTGRG